MLIVYDYGDNVMYVEGDVYYGEMFVLSFEEYYEVVVEMVFEGEFMVNEDWLFLGVFVVVVDE